MINIWGIFLLNERWYLLQFHRITKQSNIRNTRGPSTESYQKRLIKLFWAFWIWGAYERHKNDLVYFSEFLILLKYLSINNSISKQTNVYHEVWSNLCSIFRETTWTWKIMKLGWAALCYIPKFSRGPGFICLGLESYRCEHNAIVVFVKED